MTKTLVWTELTRECYNRRQQGLTCEGCDLIPRLETLKKCEIIWDVIEIYRIWGSPELDRVESYELSGLKRCHLCQTIKPISEFERYDNGKYSYMCNKCKNRRKNND